MAQDNGDRGHGFGIVGTVTGGTDNSISFGHCFSIFRRSMTGLLVV